MKILPGEIKPGDQMRLESGKYVTVKAAYPVGDRWAVDIPSVGMIQMEPDEEVIVARSI